MSARDDFPLLAGPTARANQRREMCDEIDRLRAAVETQRKSSSADGRVPLCQGTSVFQIVEDWVYEDQQP